MSNPIRASVSNNILILFDSVFYDRYYKLKKVALRKRILQIFVRFPPLNCTFFYAFFSEVRKGETRCDEDATSRGR